MKRTRITIPKKRSALYQHWSKLWYEESSDASPSYSDPSEMELVRVNLEWIDVRLS